jgi:hypothetical protein
VPKCLEKDQGNQASQRTQGVGPVLGGTLLVEIGAVTRFRDATALRPWAGLTPRYREPDRTVHPGRVTKQGPKLMRWASGDVAQELRGATSVEGACGAWCWSRPGAQFRAAGHGRAPGFGSPGLTSVAPVLRSRPARQPAALFGDADRLGPVSGPQLANSHR